MTDSPYKPPKPPAGAGGGHAPIPAVPVAARRHGAIPAAPVQLPRRPLEAGEEEATHDTDPANRWAYQYRGNAGTPPGDIDDASNDFPLKPSIELPEARPLAVQFYQDTQTLQPATTPTLQTFEYLTFDGSSTSDDDIGPGTFRLGAAAEQFEATTIYVAVPPSDGNLREYLERNVSTQIALQYESSYLRFAIDGWEFFADTPSDYVALTVTPLEHFINETVTPQPPGGPTTQTFTDYTFDDSSDEPAGLAESQFRLVTAGNQEDSTTLYIRVPEAVDSLRVYLEANTQLTIEIDYGTSWITFDVTDWSLEEGVGSDVLTLSLTPTGNSLNETDGPLDPADAVGLVLAGLALTPDVVDTDGPIDDAQAVVVVMTGLALPNAGVRARVRYRSGKSEVQFDCDWAGGFQVHADRLEIARVVFAPDTSRPYLDAAVDISATVLADAPRPGGSISLTVPPVAVPRPTGERYYAFPIHALARRVNLLLKYGNDEDAPGDAPLGQLFLAFVGKYDRSLCYIDAMAAREALFGAGLPVPAGVSKLVLSNRSLDDSVHLGVVWRLDI